MTEPFFGGRPDYRHDYTAMHAMQGRAFDSSGLVQSTIGAVPPRHRLKVIGALVIFGFGIVCGIELEKASVHVGDGQEVTPGQYEYQPVAPSVTAVPAVPSAPGAAQ